MGQKPRPGAAVPDEDREIGNFGLAGDGQTCIEVSQKAIPSFEQALLRLRKASRSSRPTLLRLLALTLRLVTWRGARAPIATRVVRGRG